jgi:hypothetical protein
MLLKRRFCIIILLLISVLGCEAKNQVKTPDVFGIYISTLDGENRKMIISDHYREMNHVRVSPDKKWITFTRFNKRGPKGFAIKVLPALAKRQLLPIVTGHLIVKLLFISPTRTSKKKFKSIVLI